VSKFCCKIVPLSEGGQLSKFDCGAPELNEWLQKHSRAGAKSGSAQTFVAVDSKDEIVGYYALTVQSVIANAAPSRLAKGMPRHPIPVILLARLAVDEKFKGQGIGVGLLKNALLRCLNASKEMGVRAVIVDAKNDAARLFYQHFNFAPFPGEKNRLFLLIKDLDKIIRG
jgi:predicted N-acetyltransferase YhbS